MEIKGDVMGTDVWVYCNHVLKGKIKKKGEREVEKLKVWKFI